MSQAPEFNMQHLFALKELIMGDEEEEEQQIQQGQKGSVLNPGNLGKKSGDDKKEIARPFSKINIKPGQKPEEVQQQKEQMQQQFENMPNVLQKKNKDLESKKNNKTDIFDEDEVKELPIQTNDTRKRPEFDQMLKQNVGTQDVFLGTTGMDPTSTKCQQILLKIYLPEVKFKDIQLDVTKTGLVLQTSQYYLHHTFPYNVKDKEGNAKWISDKEILQLTFPIVRDFEMPDF
ncbi:hypothetical protein PPERSA_07301 [Pseudocohnilembus persalinus]|uniref:PIH1D1/2/3 CS-like domain-containing protein n=1 Tax=Pseudocohnilembus persalinus TaxID=266149 RepID=A0A0V0Q771_PSEPJ|nr:hypothetical protein PPERSA_07301 [Pseudocohnilembus persalinus]|eukprot:KRW98076.1 hypothetical protein PPERSA_07301 [Pseudocohnilembus persalinus]